MIKSKKFSFLSGALSLALTIWAQTILGPLLTKFTTYLFEKSTGPTLAIINFIKFIFNINVPVYSIALFIAIIWLIYKVGNAIILSKRELKIIKADYGSGNVWCDITNQLNDFIVNNKLNITLSNSICGKDPVPHTLKIGKITYRLGKKTFTNKYKEEENIKLP